MGKLIVTPSLDNFILECGVRSKAHIQNYSVKNVLIEMKGIYLKNSVGNKLIEDTSEVSI